MTFHAGPVPASTVLYVPFSTYAGSTGASVTCSGLAVTDIEIYKNGSVTQRASDAGYTLLDTDGIDFDAITGLHGFSIDLADNTDAGFFAVGSWYWVVVSAITVDSQTVTFLAATFRIAPAEGITGYPKNDIHALGGIAQSLTDLKDFADDGYDPSTNKVQGVVLTDALTTYTGNTPQTGDSFARLGATGSGLTSLATQASVDAVGVKTTNLPSDPADQSIVIAATDAILAAVNLRATQTSVDTIDGIVDTIKLNTDYPDDCVYVDTVNGVAGTVVGVNGTIGNPSNSFADAATIATSRGRKRLRLVPRANDTLSGGTFTDYDIDLDGGKLAINQNAALPGSTIYSSSSRGTVQADFGDAQTTVDIDTASRWENIMFLHGLNVTDYCYMEGCVIGAYSQPITVTCLGASTNPVYLQDCYTAKESGLTFDVGGGADLILNGWSGDLEITNLAAGTTVQNYSYGAAVTIDASCTGGTVRHVSHVEITDLSGGAVTQDLISEASPWNPAWDAEVADAIWDEPQSGHTTAGTFGKYLDDEISGVSGGGSESTLLLDTTIASVTSQTVLVLTAGSADPDAYNNQLVVITDAVTANQKASVLVSDYVGSTKTLTLASTPVFTVAATDVVKIMAIGQNTSVNVLPATGIMANRSAGTTLLPAIGETISQAITVYESDGTTAVDLSGKTLAIIFETMSGTDVSVVAAADITISGADDNIVTFAYPASVTATLRTLRFAIRDAAAPLTLYLQGVCSVVDAPVDDP